MSFHTELFVQDLNPTEKLKLLEYRVDWSEKNSFATMLTLHSIFCLNHVKEVYKKIPNWLENNKCNAGFGISFIFKLCCCHVN